MKKAQNAQNAIINAIAARIEAAENDNQKRTLSVELSQFKTESAARALEILATLDFDAKALAQQIAKSDKKESDFLAVYALQKVRKAIFALAQKSVDSLDKYTFSIVKNLAKLQTLDTVNAYRSICSKIELDEMQQAQAVKVYHNCSPSTASTQASSTRMMLKALNVCNVRKATKGDTISFADNKLSEQMQKMFA